MSAIVFDFDGTIADSRDYFIDFISREAGKYPLDAEAQDRLHGLPLTGVARVLGIPWWRMPNLYFKGRSRMDSVIRDLQPFADIADVIRKLHAEGHELFIISSNSVKNIRIFLKKHEMREYFVEVYGGVEIFGKASMFHQLLRENNLKAKEVISIGDEIRDIEAANTVGIKSIAVTWGFSRLQDLQKLRPTRIAYEPQQLISVIEEL
ncbi:MAG TPA: HAD-IA family hydrolase [Candidatus Saccharimonadales bacterium]|nr:HAD-IA family hydrolase [Candidatus Saccharimonadales bacterium]